jgi:hypothetical protein
MVNVRFEVLVVVIVNTGVLVTLPDCMVSYPRRLIFVKRKKKSDQVWMTDTGAEWQVKGFAE